jgi:hypothetical protein
VSGDWEVRIPGDLYAMLTQHLFPASGGEHGAILAAGVAERGASRRLLVRHVFPAVDGRDYVPGTRGYRMLRAEFVRDCVLFCRDEGLAYLAVHNHGPGDSVGFSSIDLESHERGYPALLDVAAGPPVGALVFATAAVAGDIWNRDGSRGKVERLVALGSPNVTLMPKPLSTRDITPQFQRQSLLFGASGQHILERLKVGVIGCGGVGSMLVEYLARVGVGHLVVADPDVIELSNLPRLIGARQSDVGRPAGPEMRKRPATRKVRLARRLVEAANPTATFQGLAGEFQDCAVVVDFLDCDYMFLAADSMQARFLFNAIVQQYFIPGWQVGSKVLVEPTTGAILNVFAVVRPIGVGVGCLWCNGLVTPSGLQFESMTPRERRDQQYVSDPAIEVPSVITLNAVGAGLAANDFLFTALGLQGSSAQDYLVFEPIGRELRYETPRRDVDCPECGLNGRLGRGDALRLPTRQ